MRRALVGLAVALMLAGAGLGTARVVELERAELDHTTGLVELQPGPDRQVLTRIRFQAGDHIHIQVCSPGGMSPDRWQDQVAFEVWYPDAGERVVSTPLDRDRLAGVRRSAQGACLAVAEGSGLPLGGDFTVEAAFLDGAGSLAGATVWVRATALRPLASGDDVPVWLALGGALLLVLAFLVRARRDPFVEGETDVQVPPDEPGPDQPPAEARPAPRERATTAWLRLLVIGLTIFVGSELLVAFIPLGGASGGLVRGAILATVQVGAALVLLRSDLTVLGFGSSRRARWLLVPALVVGIGLRFAGAILSRLIPATGEAPIEALVSWPSGSLAVAVVGVLVPVVEEVFFRGFVYGVIERRMGANTALAATTVLFALAHLPQVWGAWGALASITLTGLVLTGLRRASGSTVVPMAAHLAHNGLISLLAVSG